MPFQTQTEIRETLTREGLRPQHKHGQNFLIDRNLMQKILDAADVTSDDVVLEIGPGTGSLTSLLAERAAHVVTVEIDQRIAEVARKQLAPHDNVTLLVTDALRGKNHLNPEVIETFLSQHRQVVGRAMLVANLPYNAASPIVADLLLQVPQVSTLCFTVQKEVADRMTAQPRTSDYGPLTVVIQALATARRIARIPPTAFWPAPDVESAIVKIQVEPQRRQSVGDAKHLAAIVHQLFLHRRKTLWQNLRLAYETRAEEIKDRVTIDWRNRPEELTVEEWVRLGETLPAIGDR